MAPEVMVWVIPPVSKSSVPPSSSSELRLNAAAAVVPVVSRVLVPATNESKVYSEPTARGLIPVVLATLLAGSTLYVTNPMPDPAAAVSPNA